MMQEEPDESGNQSKMWSFHVLARYTSLPQAHLLTCQKALKLAPWGLMEASLHRLTDEVIGN